MNVLKIGPYRILRNLGSGGSADVYEAEDGRLRRCVALKVLRSKHDADEEQIRRFELEARFMSSMNHPNVLTVYETGRHDNVRFIATELVDGETLRKRLNHAPLPVLESLDIAIGVASALEAAHEAWVVHRDIKPENIMIRRDQGIKVLDFGVAKLTRPTVDDDAATGVGRVFGTVDYLSPEQVRGDLVDNRSDLFSLCVVLYEMLTGAPPFCGPTTMDKLAATVEGDVPPLPESLPLALHRILAKGLQKNNWERYQTATDLVADLRKLRNEIAGATTPSQG